ncbi:hypothetical protein ACKA06_05670 [Rossellomorea oryzaecorticis]|uniref:Uncharacterized protein n=1 Tax=Rossellomorea oryzaecorticis TaxID=1396505 RepID=A0ABW8VP66_9BACI
MKILENFVITRILLILIQRNEIDEIEVEKLQFHGFDQTELVDRLKRLEFMKFHMLHHHYQYKSPIITTIRLKIDAKE